MSSLTLNRLVALAVLFVLAASVSAGYFKWTDENGVTHFSDQPPGADGKPVRPNGTTIIPMRENIRTQKRVEQINNPKPAPSRLTPSSVRTGDSKSQWEKAQKAKEEQRQQLQCRQYQDRISQIDRRLRAGGYSVGQGNRLRGERRQLIKRRAWECLRD